MKISRTFNGKVSGFSLVEILIVSVLLSIIILGLLLMFQQTQKAFRVGLTQTDVLEAGRATTDLIARELQQITSSKDRVVNFYAEIQYPRLEQALPGTPQVRTNFFTDMFFLTRENQTWKGIGYRFDPVPNNGLRTLLRYEAKAPVGTDLTWMINDFYNTNVNPVVPVASGVIHFKVRAFDLKGILLTNEVKQTIADTIIKMSSGNYAPGEVGYYSMTNKTIPASIEFELGILESREQDHVRALSDVPTAAAKYLEQQAGKVHIFRQRVTVRNVDPSVYQ